MKTHCLLVCALGLLTLSSSGAETGAPKETPLFITAKADDDRMDERIFPIGWSADGKFAWLSRNVEEASDDGLWTLSVLDTTSNKIAEAAPFPFKDKPGDGLAKFWAKNAKPIRVILEKHGVKAGPVIMDHLPVILGRRRNHIVAASLTVKEEELDVGGMGVKTFAVNLRLGEKTSVILEKKYDVVRPFAVALAGCFHSPDERFAVIVVTALERGYEGAPHPRVVEAMAGFQLEEP